MLAEHARQLTGAEQAALLCMLVGGGTLVYFAVRYLAFGACVIVLVAAWLLRAALILTARGFYWIDCEHARRMQRVRAYEARRGATVEP